MPLTTYTAGEVLTASSLNSNLSFAATSGGLTTVKAETSFSAVSSVTFDNIFTTSFTNYRIIMQATAAAGAPQLNITLRAAGVAASSNYQHNLLSVSGATVAGSSATAQTSWASGLLTTTAGWYIIDLINPQVAARTAATIMSNQGVSAISTIYWSANTNATAYDGLGWAPASSTITGTYTVYGYGEAIL
jgi:hypothetical protein